MSAPTFQAVGTADSATTGAITPTLPTHAAGDLIILACEGDTTSFGTDPTGYTSLGVVTGSSTKLCVWYKIAASGAESNPTITPSSANHTYAQVITFRNVHQTLPIHAQSEGSANTNSVNGALGIDTAIDDTIILQIIAYGVDNAGPLASAEANTTITVTERHDAGSINGNGGGLIMYTGSLAAAGRVAQTTFTLAASTNTAMMTIAIAPIADYTIAGTVTVNGSAVSNGNDVRAFDLTQPAASYLCATVTTTGGTGAFSISAPYNDHNYQAVYEDGSSYGASAVDVAV